MTLQNRDQTEVKNGIQTGSYPITPIRRFYKICNDYYYYYYPYFFVRY